MSLATGIEDMSGVYMRLKELNVYHECLWDIGSHEQDCTSLFKNIDEDCVPLRIISYPGDIPHCSFKAFDADLIFQGNWKSVQRADDLASLPKVFIELIRPCERAIDKYFCQTICLDAGVIQYAEEAEPQVDALRSDER